MPTSGEEIQRRFEAPNDAKEKNTHTATRVPSIIVGVVAAVVVALSVFYLLRPVPLLVQGEVDATRLDIAARVGAGDPGPKAFSMLDLHNPELDWVKLASGMGVEASRATSVEDFARQFAGAMKDRGPRLIEVIL